MSHRKLHTVSIEKLVPGGLGLGRLADGMVVFVPFVLPDELVVVREVRRRKDFIDARLHEILTPSGNRIAPFCPYYGQCGGCDLQHGAYKTQLILKKEAVGESLQRLAGDILSASGVSIEQTLGSPEEFGYRQRLRLQVDDTGRYGYFRPGSHDLQSVARCLLAGKKPNMVFEQLSSSEHLPELLRHGSGFELLCDPDSSDVIMLLHFKRKPRPKDSSLAAEIVNHIAEITSFLMQVEGHGLFDPVSRSYMTSSCQLSQTASLQRLPNKLKLTWEAGGFSQVNPKQNINLINLVLEMIMSGPLDRVLDLYCGYGNFSLPIAKIAGEVVGIDIRNSAIRSGIRNLQLNEIENCRFEKIQVEAGIRSLIAAGEKFDTVVLDPPRQGAEEAVSMISDLGAQQVLYVSCNPATLARDLAILYHKGFKLSRLVPVDMFPQTHHVECVSLLKRMH